MWITSSLIGMEGEFLTNVVIDGILRPKTGYPHIKYAVSLQRHAHIRTDIPWKESESAYRAHHASQLRSSKETLKGGQHRQRRTHQFNETVLPELFIPTNVSKRYTPTPSRRNAPDFLARSPLHDVLCQ